MTFSTAGRGLIAWLCLFFCVNSAYAAAPAGLGAFFADQIWPGDGPKIQDGVLLVRNGTILAVGRRAEVILPQETRRHRLGNVVMIPGLVVAETELAMGNSERALSPDLRAIDGFDLFKDYGSILAGGVTTVQIVAGSDRLMPGQGAVVKLAGSQFERRILSRSESLQIVLSSSSRNPPTIFEPPVGAVSVDRPLLPTKAQLAQSLASSVAGLRAVYHATEAELREGGDASGFLEAVARFRQPHRHVRVTARTSAEIRSAIKLGREFDLRMLLVDPVGMSPFGNLYKTWHPHVSGVVLNIGVRPGQVDDSPLPKNDVPAERPVWDHARRLLDGGLPVALKVADDEDLSEILFLAALFQQGEITQDEILRMLTIMPAQMLGVSRRVGSLQTGKDADFVLLDRSPFSTHTRVLATYVEGERVHEEDRASETTVVRAGTIYGAAGRIVKGGSLVVRGKKIVAVGNDISAPLDARTRTFATGVAVPGYIDLGTGLGLGGPLAGSITVQTKLGEQLFAGDPAVAVAREGGTTTVLLGPQGSSTGPLVAFKLGRQLTVLKDPVAIRFSLKGNVTSNVDGLRRTLNAAKEYADGWTRHEKQLAEYQEQVKEFEAAQAKYEAAKKRAAEAKKAENAKGESKDDASAEKTSGPTEATQAAKRVDKPGTDRPEQQAKETKGGKDPATPAPKKPAEPTKPKLVASREPYRPLFSREIPAFVAVKTAPEIRAALTLFRDEFELKTVLVGADDAALNLDLLAEKDVAVSTGPILVRQVDGELVNLPQLLANHQLSFGFQSLATTGARNLPLAVQFAVRKGLGARDALRGFTTTPAQLLSLDERIGTLEVGKDADLVVLSGPPFEVASRVLAVMIDGEWVYDAARQGTGTNQ